MFALFALFALSSAPVSAQDTKPALVLMQERLKVASPADTFAVAMRDGSSFVGRVIAVRGDTVEMTTTVGTLRFAIGDVRRVTAVRSQDVVNGEYWFPNPNTTRLLFAPTGRMLKKGEGYFSDYMLFLPGVAGGLNDRITIGGGFSILPGVGLDEQLFYVTPKLGVIAGDKLNVAIGVLAARFGLRGAGREKTFAIPYVVGTYGSEKGSVTTGIGYGYANGKLANSPALLLGGDARLSRRFGLVTENYVFPSSFDGAAVSVGARFFGEKLSADFGLVRLVGGSDGVTLPYVGFVANF